MGGSVQGSGRTVWENDSVMQIEIYSRPPGVLQRLQYPGSIFWMTAL
jgi:hypothetical protein